MPKSIIAAIVVCGLAGGPAASADYAGARAPVALAVWPPLYLGHFSGGRTYPSGDPMTPYVLGWRDEFARFDSRGGCYAWLSGMRRAWPRFDGYRTCLRLR